MTSTGYLYGPFVKGDDTAVVRSPLVERPQQHCHLPNLAKSHELVEIGEPKFADMD